jgi:hypothetical protein
MKRVIILGIFSVITALSVSAQSFYFDIGIGFGKGWTEIEGYDVVDTAASRAFGFTGNFVYDLAADIGLRAGCGPFGNIPLYVVGELAGMGHRVYDEFNYIQFNSYIIGPGVIFYPIPLIQLGFSVGPSFIKNQTDFPMLLYDSKGGFAWDVSAAIDLGKRNHGFLIGLKYFAAYNILEISNADVNSSMLSIFIKYAYRHKAPSLF